MVYTIREISTDSATGLTYTLVEFWRTDTERTRNPNSPWLVNDFLLQLSTVGERYVTNATGQFKRKDNGQFETPAEDADLSQYERETFDRSPRAEIEAAIDAYWTRAASGQWSGNHTGENRNPFFVGNRRVNTPYRPRGRNQLDPNGVIAKARDEEQLTVVPRLEVG